MLEERKVLESLGQINIVLVFRIRTKITFITVPLLVGFGVWVRVGDFFRGFSPGALVSSANVSVGQLK